MRGSFRDRHGLSMSVPMSGMGTDMGTDRDTDMLGAGGGRVPS